MSIIKDLVSHIDKFDNISIQDLILSAPCKLVYYKNLLLVEETDQDAVEIAERLNKIIFPDKGAKYVADLGFVTQILIWIKYGEKWFGTQTAPLVPVVLLTKLGFLTLPRLQMHVIVLSRKGEKLLGVIGRYELIRACIRYNLIRTFKNLVKGMSKDELVEFLASEKDWVREVAKEQFSVLT